MRWFPDIASAAFCETIQLRKRILERQQSRGSSLCQALEPTSAEFIAALAAGINSRNILQVGCGISTISLAAAAQATGGFLVSIHTDEDKQDIVRHNMKYLGLLEFVEFIVSEPRNVLPTKKDIDFAFFTGDPKDYIELFDLLNLNNGAIVVADNALSEASNEYIRHVRRQPGVDSYTLPLARGIEVTKMVAWDKFKLGRIMYFDNGVNEEMESGILMQPFMSSVHEATTTSRHSEMANQSFSGQDESEFSDDQMNACSSEEISAAKSDPVMLEMTYTPHDIGKPINGGLDSLNPGVEELQVTSLDLFVEVVSDQVQEASRPTSSQDIFSDAKEPCIEYNTPDDHSLESLNDPETLLSSVHENVNPGSDKAFKPCLKKSDVTSVFKVQFQNHSMETEVSITGVNQEMLLSDITTAFSDMGVSVKTANISTQNNLIEDIFFVTNAKSGAPLHPSQWDAIRDRILQRIGERWNRD